jgi:pimeloyl-ACP methyl ester carboxylesterase
MVYDELSAQGITVRVVQMPMDGFAADVEATRRILDDVQGSTVLVGHSYGGGVITELGMDEKVRALVYVAALEPDAGESLASLSKRFPPAAQHAKMIGSDRFVPDPATFHADLAADLPVATSAFLAASLKPTPLTANTATVDQVAWKTKPSYGIVATEDRTISPDLERFMYKRAGTKVTEVASSHMVLMSRPKEVAKVIMAAVNAAE